MSNRLLGGASIVWSGQDRRNHFSDFKHKKALLGLPAGLSVSTMTSCLERVANAKVRRPTRDRVARHGRIAGISPDISWLAIVGAGGRLNAVKIVDEWVVGARKPDPSLGLVDKVHDVQDIKR